VKKVKICGLIGNKIEASISPAIHNHLFKRHSVNCVYKLFSFGPEKLLDALSLLRDQNTIGANVTIPFKEKIIPFIDVITPEAKIIGAVNTITNNNGKLIGDNTDSKGFIQSLSDHSVTFDKAFILGSGGAAKAICHGLAANGCQRITIHNRNIERAEILAKRIRDSFEQTDIDVVERIEDYGLSPEDLVVNCTPVGTRDELSWPAEKLFYPTNWVIDLIYRQTPLIKKAKREGANSMDGTAMLIRQAALSFQRWTGILPSAKEIEESLVKL
jgi:shikimate dehydrogenase